VATTMGFVAREQIVQVLYRVAFSGDIASSGSMAAFVASRNYDDIFIIREKMSIDNRFVAKKRH